MRGVSEVIAIILILMITISLAGLAYMFMSTTMSDVTSSAGSTVDTTTSSMMTSFNIESVDVAKVYIRNTGQNALTSLSVYVNNEPATYNVTTPIAAGSVGTITIYSFIPDGATVKVTSPNGFSTSKVAHPCEKAVGCWKFDESSGTSAYDSSPYGNTGTLVNGPTWTSGRYGGGLLFDGSNDYVDAGNSSVFNITNSITLSAWIKTNQLYTNYWRLIVGKQTHSVYSFFVEWSGNGGYVRFEADNSTTRNAIAGPEFAGSVGEWIFLTGVYDSSDGIMRLYKNGVLFSSGTVSGSKLIGTNIYPVLIGGYGAQVFNGTIDEVRIYNRVIY